MSIYLAKFLVWAFASDQAWSLLPRRPSPTPSPSSRSRTLVWRLRRTERRSSTEMGGGFTWGILLAHAGYATSHYRAMLKIVEEFASPPMNALVEILLGLALSIHPDSEENRYLHFYKFN
ncbi:uncharacterized protein LOC135650753 isoform X1 [Musa acuminata AAA Group]|uniref:uncharacterized protein LOC135650753 isoform X1 n=2 Tax=Musa acuminata AAA Group TaxID=214697 RepID=UPI0031D80C10